jgi:hypothetical protein
VQLGQRVALIGIAEKQYGHSLVAGAAAGTGFFHRFTWRITRKITNATIKKSITVFRNNP